MHCAISSYNGHWLKNQKDFLMATWLLVEDEPDLYDTLLTMFEIWNTEGLAFTNISGALDWIDGVEKQEFVKELPELALIDVRLPYGRKVPEALKSYVRPDGTLWNGGLLISRRLRDSSSPELRDLLIVLITAFRFTPSEEKTHLEQAGADHIFYKPLDEMAVLKDKLNRLMRQKNRD